MKHSLWQTKNRGNLTTASGRCLAQEHTRSKDKEIPAIKAPLDTRALKGGIVTMGAIALLRQDTQSPKRSLRARRKTADRIHD